MLDNKLEYKEGCEKIAQLVSRLDIIVNNYKQSNRKEIKDIGKSIEKFRKSFDSTNDLYEIRQYLDLTLYSILKEEIDNFDKIVREYQNNYCLKEDIENGETIYITTNDPHDIQPSAEERNTHTTIADIKKMLDKYPDDMIVLGDCEGGVYTSPSFTTLSLDDDTLEEESIYFPEEYNYKDKNGDIEFLLFQ